MAKKSLGGSRAGAAARSGLHLVLLAGLAACPAVNDAIDKDGDAAKAVTPPVTKTAGTPETGATDGEEAPGKEVVQPAVQAEDAPPASPRLAVDAPVTKVLERTKSHFAGKVGRRIYVQVDKPLYKPGETVWIKSWDLRARDLGGLDGAGVRYELVSPKGAVVLTKRVREAHGAATNDLEIPEGVQGGEYVVRATANDGVTGERPIIVSTYEAPRLKKKLELLKKAYGAGEEVTATVKVERPTGEPLANHPLTANVWLDGESLQPVKVTTNAEGGALVRFQLPERMEKGDGLLTVLVEDGGVTESVSKRVPIILKKLQVSFFPEGGQLVAGLPGRVYFEAKNTLGKPAEVEGKIVDDHGNAVATFSSYHAGLGRVEFTPATGRRYSAEISRPAGISERYALPLVAEQGCVLRSYDDLDGQLPALRVAVRCSEPKQVIVAALQREQLLDAAKVEVPADAPAIVHLTAEDAKLARQEGVARVTVLDERLVPIAERIVFRNRRNGLSVEITPDKTEYTPREQVALTVKTTDGQGLGVPAELALSVVDDTVVSFADDKTGHLLSRLFLEPEVPEKVEEPNFFFDLTKPKSALAMDLLMGTRGYRRFEWQQVLEPPPPPRPVATAAAIGDGEIELNGVDGLARPEAEGGAPQRRPGGGRGMIPRAAMGAGGPVAREPMLGALAEDRKHAAPVKQPLPASPPMGRAQVAPREDAAPMAVANEVKREAKAVGQLEEAAKPARRARVAAELDDRMAGAPAMIADEAERPADMPAMKADKDWAVEKKKIAVNQAVAWAPVRVFPAPAYRGDETGPRTDFRETIHWAPTVLTGKDGRATVTFYLSDAVTSFRVFAEGVGAGAAGRAEKVFKSSLPFNMSVKLPVEVSAGDHFLLPLTLVNDRDKAVNVSLTSAFGDLLVLEKGVEREAAGAAILSGEPDLTASLGAGERKSVFFPVSVKGTRGKSTIRVKADASGLADDFVRELEVVPVGFPQLLSRSGTLQDRYETSVDLSGALDGSVVASVRLYPSPVSTMLSGLDGMLREPGGCFEQTSATNYPNIMVMQYMRANDLADAGLAERAGQLLDRGYKRLVGFETPNKGYEWFGQAPGHEALTAYGLLEFADFKQVYGGVDDEMMRRTAAWISARKDGRGGYQRDAKALDSFGSAKPEVTNAYITYSVTEAKLGGFDAEIEAEAGRVEAESDPYLLALRANTLLNVPSKRAQGAQAVKRLASLQKDDGRWAGLDHSITRSTGINLDIETTSLALLALMKQGGHDEAVRKGVEWIYKNRGGYGAWNATQATVLALKALTRYSSDARKTQAPGEVSVSVNGKVVSRMKYEAGRREPLVLTGVAEALVRGKNDVVLVHDGSSRLPFSMAIEYRAEKPATDPKVVVDLETKLERTTVKMGENVRLTAKVTNKTAEGQPMTIARIGLPSGLSFQTWQLKELKDKGLVAFWETRAREVILYFRDLAPSAVKEIPLDLVALIPGEFTGQASSAYLYYSDDAKVWTDGLSVTVTR